MDLSKIMKLSAAGLKVQNERMRVIEKSLWHDSGPSREALQALFEKELAEGKAWQAAQIAALVIGGVAVAAGTTLLILKPSGERRTAHFAPMFSENSVGASGTFTF